MARKTFTFHAKKLNNDNYYTPVGEFKRWEFR